MTAYVDAMDDSVTTHAVPYILAYKSEKLIFCPQSQGVDLYVVRVSQFAYREKDLCRIGYRRKQSTHELLNSAQQCRCW